MNATLNQTGFESVSVSVLPVKLRDYLPATQRFHHAIIGVVGGAVRWLAIPSEDPSASYGSYVGAGGQIEWINPEVNYAGLIDNVKFIRAGGVDATLEVALFW